MPFEIREQYDIDRLVDEYADLNQQQLIVKLKADFHDSRLLWSRLYEKFEWFWQAYTDALIRSTYNKTSDNIEDVIIQDLKEKQPEHYRTALLIRDNHRCRCCGRLLGKGVKLEIDHIIPVKVGGKTTLDNLQVLCKNCNIEKGTHLISFLNNRTPLEKPTDFKFTKSNSYEPIDCTIKRIINFFYRANAVCNIEYHQRRSGKHYFVWTIHLHEGNPVEWLLPYKKEIVRYIQDELGLYHVQDINIVTG